MKMKPILLGVGLFLCGVMPIQVFSQVQASVISEAQVISETPVIQLTAGVWEPFTGEHLPSSGIGADIVKQAFAIEGIEVEYFFRPWKRAYLEAQNGIHDGSIFWRMTPERKQYFYFSDPVITDEVVFFHLKSEPFDWRKLDDLKNSHIQVGLIIGFHYEDNFDAAVKEKQITVQRVATQEQNLQKLFLQRINITPIPKVSGYATINKIFTKEQAALFTHHPLPLAKNAYHLILSKKKAKNQHIMQLFNKGLKRLQGQ